MKSSINNNLEATGQKGTNVPGDMLQSNGNIGSGMSRDWLKVSQLQAGMQIAVPKAECFADHAVGLADDSVLEADGTGDRGAKSKNDMLSKTEAISEAGSDVMWDEIEEIRECGEEQVWDIEVEGTHNFVAGHLIDKKSGNQLSEEEEADHISGKIQKDCWYGSIFAHNTYITGNVGIATSTPGYGLHVGSFADPKDVMIAKGALCVDDDDACGGALTDGSVYAVGAYSQTADYAEYFYSNDQDLEPGELVCVDVTIPNAVKRCLNGADGNLMGIVSTAPAFTGNATNETRNNPNYKIIGMLGQLPTKASDENGPIRPGDSLTSSPTLPGYAMRADAGDPTVGVALESLPDGTGRINVLVSRRNKSLTVAEVESKVVERIAAMEIEDEVAILVANAVSAYNFDPIVEDKITEEVDALEVAFGLSLEQKVAELTNLINNNKLSFIKEQEGKVRINTNLTIAGTLESSSGIAVLLDSTIASSTPELATTTQMAFRVEPDGTVTAFNDFIIGNNTEELSVKEAILAIGAEEIIKTNLTAKQDLSVGESLTVYGTSVLGESTQKPTFKVGKDGTITVREDLVLAGYSVFKELPGLVDIFAYNAKEDPDSGAWTGNGVAKAGSWYNEQIDATAQTCSLEENDRCATRAFPAQAIIAATADTVYVFDGKDGSLWMKFSAPLFAKGGAITKARAFSGAIYVAQESGITEIDFIQDAIRFFAASANSASESLFDYSGPVAQRNLFEAIWTENSAVAEPLIMSDEIRSLGLAFIFGNKYLAIAGNRGIDLINLDTLKTSHYDSDEAQEVRITSSGDLYFASNQGLSAIYKAQNFESELSISAQYHASSTPALALENGIAGMHVSERTSVASSTKEIIGNTVYLASGSKIFAISENQKAQDQSVIREYDSSDGDARALAVDENAGVMYALSDSSIAVIAQNSMQELDKISSLQDDQGSEILVPGSLVLAGMSLGQSSFESADTGSPQSDLFALASNNGLFVSSTDYSLRDIISSISGASQKQMPRVSIIDEEIFSGKVAVKDKQKDPVFAIDEKTGNQFSREDIIMGADKKMMALNGVVQVFVYDVASDSDAGEWRNAISEFSQKAIIAATADSVLIYDGFDKSEIKRISGDDYDSLLASIGTISSVSAKDHILGIVGEHGIGFIDLARDTAEFVPITRIALGLGTVSFATARGNLYALLELENGAMIVSLADYSSSLFDSQAGRAISAQLSEGGDLYIARENSVRTFFSAAFNKLGSDEADVEYSESGTKIAGMEYAYDPIVKNGDVINSMALRNSTMYVGHTKGITIIDLSDHSFSYMEQSSQTKEFFVFESADEYTPSPEATSITSISLAGINSLLVSSQKEGQAPGVYEISETGIIFDQWTNSAGRADNFGVPYSADQAIGASFASDVVAIAAKAKTGDDFVWMESRAFSLREKLEHTRVKIAVIDKIQTRLISSVSSLSITASSTISFFVSATSTPALVIPSSGPIEAQSLLVKNNLLIDNDLAVKGALRLGGSLIENYFDFSISENGSLRISSSQDQARIVVSPSGNVGIGTDNSSHALTVSGESGGSLCVDDGTGVCDGLSATAGDIYYNAAHAAYTDVAENYPTTDATLGAGEIVMLDINSDLLVERADDSSKVLGIVSTNPGLTLGDYGACDSPSFTKSLSRVSRGKGAGGGSSCASEVPVALSGRVPVKISLENGAIVRGDYLTPSKTIPGAAMKLIGSGQVIGIALQSYNGLPVAPLTDGQDPHQVMVFIQQFYQYDDSSIVRVFDTKIIDIQKQIDELKARVEDLEKWRAKQGE
ncbi:MAG: hypothetical protein COV79_04075 [Parcubacteria group bacterium CG11_big_fil_rev_8_21_14_0_20_41_14]|nr:MAG: hypothetical protein COV79_04075 [Parcubacteria group bacterium CG11_big_fil_rev_8_21_14_0_20_41_14]